MGKYDIDKDLYTTWLKDKMTTIETMTREQIEERVIEISRVEFYCKREWALLHDKFDKLTGRKGIAPWLKEERDKLITNPDIQVNWDGDPRKKEKKPKQDMIKDLLNIDIKDMAAALKGKKKDNGKADFQEALDDMITAKPLPEKPKASQEEIDAKAAALKERMRIAKEAKQ